MGKISPVSAKYIIHATININGVVDRPDVIGAIFGQTEGLLGSELELRELQRSGRIGRIEVNVETSSGKTTGTIQIPSSLDKSETAIVAAALEIIDRIGPCEAHLRVNTIEDVRVSKRQFVVERAKELLKEMMDKSLPDSQEISDEVAQSVRVMELTTYGKDRLSAGPNIDEYEEIIVVEGRADVINLLKNGFKNVISMNGTNVPETIVELCSRKIVTVFVDGDRGGDLILKELMGIAEIDYVARAPDGKEVEEITKKEIHKALRSRLTVDQYRLEKRLPPLTPNDKAGLAKPKQAVSPAPEPAPKVAKAEKGRKPEEGVRQSVQQGPEFSDEEKERFREMADELIGSRGAYLLDEKLKIMGKVPLSELEVSLRELANKVFAIVADSAIDKELVEMASKGNVRCLVGKEVRGEIPKSRITIMVTEEI